uniref:Capsid protein n=1 Tax=Alphatorquevirus homin20 TaxID=3048422 RepID=A0AAU7SSJ2_9VIRU
MPWWRWRRGWRWPRRRWRTYRRRRRLPRRRPRRPVRRPRRRRVRRRRGRGWYRGRRYSRRLYRRRYVRRKRKTLIWRQWQPQNIRKCRIRGIIPMIICGHLRSNKNYALHSDDIVEQNTPFGGALSTTSWSLKVLYDQHQRGLNRWSSSNEMLDLARYNGCRFTFYRDKKTDFIVTYDISAPYKLDKYSSPSYHPGMMMLKTKNKILIPSFDTKPKGKSTVSVRIKPPKLFLDKWYTQEDLCTVNLVTFAVSAASFTHPFCPPQTDNPCCTFQVLKDFYYPIIGYSAAETKVSSVFSNILYKHCTYYQSFLTQQFIGKIVKLPDGTLVSSLTKGPGNYPEGSNINKASIDNYNNWLTEFNTGANQHYNFCNYKPQYEKLEWLRKYYFEWETYKKASIPPDHITPSVNWYEYHIGLFSPIFLSPFRSSSLEFPRAYQDVTYNPLVDKGVGNVIWFQYNTKADTQLTLPSCKCVIEDVPLWAAFYGYSDFVQQEIGPYTDAESVGFICVICPYTKPPMKNPDNPLMGYVFYDSNFGAGKWIDGSGFVPLYWQTRWRPETLFQESTMRDITMTGPFSYKDELKNTVLTAKYKFNFRWGGNLLHEQTIRNPCPTNANPSTGRQPRDVQVVDPLSVGPRFVFHSWDWRRGFLSEAAIKRIREQPLDYEAYSFMPKRPRFFPPTTGGEQLPREQEESSSSTEESNLISFEEGQEPKAQAVHKQLLKQLRKQRVLGQRLRALYQNLQKTQAGLHINPLLFNQA